MKRRITLEVDDTAFEASAAQYAWGRQDAGAQLAILVGQANIPGARERARVNLASFGITLIKDEQVD